MTLSSEPAFTPGAKIFLNPGVMIGVFPVAEVPYPFAPFYNQPISNSKEACSSCQVEILYK